LTLGQDGCDSLPSQRECCRYCSVAHTGQSSHATEDFVEEIGLLLGLRVLHRGQRDVHGEEVVAVEAGIDAKKLSKAAENETAADEQQHGQRDLADDEQAFHAHASVAGRAATALVA
jgi:hypothetical protein